MSHTPLILFGAFDRHNLGDLLLAEIAAQAAAPRPVLCTGLMARDMRAFGGRRVLALATVLAGWRERYGDAPPEIVQVGGEILTTTAWEALVMLQDAAGAERLITVHDLCPEREAWARAQLGGVAPAPYVLERDALRPPVRRLEFRGIGGVALAHMPGELREQVRRALAQADAVSVRDTVTQAALATLGIAAALRPDPVCAWPAALAARAARALGTPEVRAVRAAFPAGFIAVQFAAEHGSDAELDTLATMLKATGLPAVLMRAGAAPWHDDLAVYQRLTERMQSPVRLFEALDIWRIVALLSHSAGVLATSLHVRILARRYARPLLAAPDGWCSAKVRAYEASWNGSDRRPRR